MASEFSIATAVTFVTVFALITIILALQKYQLDSSVPLVRAAVRATWPVEGFANKSLEDWLPSPEALTKKSSCDTDAPAPYTQGQATTGTYTLLNDWLKPLEQPTAEQKKILDASCNSEAVSRFAKTNGPIAAGPTSQQCYQKDYKRTLERAGSYAQRTNNYRHGNGESCSAPNHDLILDFYKPLKVDAPYQV